MTADTTGLPDRVCGVVRTPASGSRQVSIAERRRLVAESLRIGNPANHAQSLPAHADPRHECQIELRVTDIRPYEHNPRRSANARFAEIKESIRAAGIRNPLTVTRRPGETHFIVESGGNTRLLAVQQLWAETGESRFEKLAVLFRPWRSENHVLTAHMVENEQRGDMTFWDRATGVIAIKVGLEAEKGAALSLRQFETELRVMGLATNPTSLSHYVFVTEKLRVLGESIPDLSAQDIKTLQPRLNALKRYAQARAGIAEPVLYASIFDPVFRQVADRYREGGEFATLQLCEACEVAVARHLAQPVDELRRDIDELNRPGREPPRQNSGDSGTSTGPASASESERSTNTQLPRREPLAVNAVDSRSTSPTKEAARDSGSTATVERSDVAALAQRLAQSAGIGAHLRSDPMAPLGFWTSVEPDAAQDLQPAALRVWSLLAHLAGAQIASGIARPPEGDGAALTRPGGTDLPGAVAMRDNGADLLDWLLDPDDALAGASLEFLGQLRAWWTSWGSRRSVPELPPGSMEEA